MSLLCTNVHMVDGCTIMGGQRKVINLGEVSSKQNFSMVKNKYYGGLSK